LLQPVPAALRLVAWRATPPHQLPKLRRFHFQPGPVMTRIASFSLALTAAFVLSACVFAPPVHTSTSTADVAKMGEQAVATCGAGNVKEVNAKSFTCK
jgi:hypothetical protein